MRYHEGLSICDCGKWLWDLQVLLYFNNLHAYIERDINNISVK